MSNCPHPPTTETLSREKSERIAMLLSESIPGDIFEIEVGIGYVPGGISIWTKDEVIDKVCNLALTSGMGWQLAAEIYFSNTWAGDSICPDCSEIHEKLGMLANVRTIDSNGVLLDNINPVDKINADDAPLVTDSELDIAKWIAARINGLVEQTSALLDDFQKNLIR